MFWLLYSHNGNFDYWNWHSIEELLHNGHYLNILKYMVEIIMKSFDGLNLRFLFTRII